MKKVLIIFTFIIMATFSVLANSSSFSIDISKIKFDSGSKIKDIKSNFNSEYEIEIDEGLLTIDQEFQREMTDLANKVTYLLLGKPDYKNGDYTDYITRKKSLLELRYAPSIPKDSEDNFITSSQEYKDDVATGINIPSMFKLLAEKNITYKDLGTTILFETDGYIITKTAISGVSIEMPNELEPIKIDKLNTNLVLTYFFKKQNNDYKLYWIMAETSENVDSYFEKKENAEDNGNALAINSKYVADVVNFYDYTKLANLKEETIQKIYKDNINRIVILNTYKDKSVINTATGFFINKGIIVTTWSYVEKALMKGQFISIRDNNGNSYEYSGFVSANPELDIAVIKLKEQVGDGITIGDSTLLKKEDPAIAIGSKSGFGLSINSGIVISSDLTSIKSLIPLAEQDGGSPLFNGAGQVIGINTTESINSSLSVAVPTTYLSELQMKLSNTSFDSIKSTSFEELKEKYYYSKYNNEKVINNVDKSVWNERKLIGDIENTIKLKLIKSNYYDGVVSLRYVNEISSFLSNMTMASSFKSKLLEDGYINVLDSKSKSIYENNKYKVIIIDEFNYLIINMVRK